MQMLDASSIIYAWDNYPEPQFPPLWRWLAAQINQKALAIAQCALEEVKKKTPEFGGKPEVIAKVFSGFQKYLYGCFPSHQHGA